MRHDETANEKLEDLRRALALAEAPENTARNMLVGLVQAGLPALILSRLRPGRKSPDARAGVKPPAPPSSPAPSAVRQPRPPRPRVAHTTRAARRLNQGAAILSLAVLADSGLEHFRATFFNKAMFTPLLVSTLTLGASVHGAQDRSSRAEHRRDAIYALAAGTGLLGTGFHIYNVGKRAGGYSWNNMFYGAPAGAPMALLLAGVFGVAAERVRNTKPGRTARLFWLPAGRVLAALTSVGLLGTVGEVALMHFRGAFQNKFMFVPVTLPPVAALLMARQAIEPRRGNFLARVWLSITALIGLAGVGFHAWGIQRSMGGWRNWSQNVMAGPPLPAPPSFTGIALAGLASLRLLREPRR